MKKTIYEKAIKANAKFANLETIQKNESEEVYQIVAKMRNRADKNVLSVKSFCDKLIIARLEKIAIALPDEGYSMKSMVKVKFCKLIGSDDRRQYYSKSCKYRPQHGLVIYNISLSDLRNTSIIGGLVTFVKPSKSIVKKCSWLEGHGSKYNFKLIRIEGFICYGYHATSKEVAKENGLRLNKAVLSQELMTKKFNKAVKLQYSYQDSLNAGNCENGTKAFALRHHLDTSKKYRGAYLLKLAENSHNTINFVKRMIQSKVY